jgi:hypothetical protein
MGLAMGDGPSVLVSLFLYADEKVPAFCGGKSTGLSEPRTYSPHSSLLIGGGEYSTTSFSSSDIMIGEDAVTLVTSQIIMTTRFSLDKKYPPLFLSNGYHVMYYCARG